MLLLLLLPKVAPATDCQDDPNEILNSKDNKQKNNI